MWFKNIKTAIIWEISDESKDLIKRIKQEHDAEGAAIYEEAEEPKTKSK